MSKWDSDKCMTLSPYLKRIQEMSETTKPNEVIKAYPKPFGFEEQHNDKIEIINFEGFRVHFFTSLTLYTFIIIGQKESIVDQAYFQQIYQALCDFVLKDPQYTVGWYLPSVEPADQQQCPPDVQSSARTGVQ